MAYKFATGSVERGDIYNEDDAQGNTYLDWNEDAVGVVAGGSTVFVVSGSTAKVGIGTDNPTSTLGVSGSVATKVSSITGTSNTIGATYTILMGSDDGVCAAQLPAAADCTGRIYIFKRLSSSGCKVQSNGSEKIENSTDDLELETQYDSYMIQSDGTEWWILSEWFNG
jgi:hypothetical protein